MQPSYRQCALQNFISWELGKVTKNYYIKTGVLHLRSNCTPFASQLYSFCIAKGVQLECKCSTFASHWSSVCYKGKNKKDLLWKIITKQAANLRLKFHCSLVPIISVLVNRVFTRAFILTQQAYRNALRLRLAANTYNISVVLHTCIRTKGGRHPDMGCYQ